MQDRWIFSNVTLFSNLMWRLRLSHYTVSLSIHSLFDFISKQWICALILQDSPPKDVTSPITQKIMSEKTDHLDEVNLRLKLDDWLDRNFIFKGEFLNSIHWIYLLSLGKEYTIIRAPKPNICLALIYITHSCFVHSTLQTVFVL